LSVAENGGDDAILEFREAGDGAVFFHQGREFRVVGVLAELICATRGLAGEVGEGGGRGTNPFAVTTAARAMGRMAVKRIFVSE
jgi:hypothetical protein